MKIIEEKSLIPSNIKDSLNSGGLIVYPTDTAYGLGVDATNNEAVEKLYGTKSREVGKPTHVVVSSLEMAKEYVFIDKRAEKLINYFMPGPLTLILKSRGNISKNILGPNDTLGIRIPDRKSIISLVEEFGKPITTTSANVSGGKTPYSVQDVKESLGEDFEKIDLVIDAGELEKN